ncbi:MAG: ATP-dependent DNA helicase [Geminicoccaceae bacterium]
MDFVPSPQQAQAISTIGNPENWLRPNQFVILAGLAGTGKTSIAPHIIEAIGARRPLFCAPTNKAAKVLTSKGLPAISLHKAMYFAPGELDPKVVRDLKKKIAEEMDPALKQDLEARLAKLEDQGFDRELAWTINPEGPASEADLILVDEASMVGSTLGNDLMSFGKPVIAIGDPGQLPPVNDTPFFFSHEPDFLLTEIHRQARDNPIIRLAHDIREGKPLRPCTMGDRVIIAHKGEIDVPTDPETMPQVITGTHRRRWSITKSMRTMMGFEGDLPNAGEKLVVRKNSMAHDQLINGADARCIKVERGVHDYSLHAVIDVDGHAVSCIAWDGPFREHQLREPVRPKMKSPDWISSMDGERFDYGWAITCHVSQDSQWPYVLVYDKGRVFREDAARWRYTAVSRASEYLAVII